MGTVDFSGGKILTASVSSGSVLGFSDSVSSSYYGFRISNGTDGYYYGWVQLNAEIAIAYAAWGSANSASVTITAMGMQDTAGCCIDAGTMIPEPTSSLMIALGGLLIVGYRRIKKTYGIK